jgi:hypothetical protein
MPSAKRARHPTQLRKLRDRIKQFEAPWADCRPSNVSLRGLYTFARRQFGRRRLAITIFRDDIAPVRLASSRWEHHGSVNCRAWKRSFS